MPLDEFTAHALIGLKIVWIQCITKSWTFKRAGKEPLVIRYDLSSDLAGS